MSEATPALRLDKWLWHARFARTRQVAGELVAQARVRINGQIAVKTHHPVRVGDVVTITSPARITVVRVTALGERRGSPADAARLYETITVES